MLGDIRESAIDAMQHYARTNCHPTSCDDTRDVVVTNLQKIQLEHLIDVLHEEITDSPVASKVVRKLVARSACVRDCSELFLKQHELNFRSF